MKKLGFYIKMLSYMYVNNLCIQPTAKTQYRKFETNIPRKGIARPQSQFPQICLWAIYIIPRSICLFCRRKYVDRSREYVNRSQTHECGNWEWGREIPRKGIHKWDFRCSAWPVYVVYIKRYAKHSWGKKRGRGVRSLICISMEAWKGGLHRTACPGIGCSAASPSKLNC